MSTLDASIETTCRQAIESADLPGLFPSGTHVYVTDIGEATEVQIAAATRLRRLGYEPIPHVAARRVTTRAALDDRLRRLTGEAGVRDVLVIGGGLEKPAGDFAGAMDVLATGLIDRHGIERVGIAGHPEGSPDFSKAVAQQILLDKQAWGERTGAEMRIVTQFGFSPDRFVAWAEGLRAHGIDLPVHLGVAGPAKITTLLKYAVMCGVGESISFLKRNALSVAALAGSQSPEPIVGPIEAHVASTPGSAIAQLHVFPFGGLKGAAGWLVERGSWTIDGGRQAVAASR